MLYNTATAAAMAPGTNHYHPIQHNTHTSLWLAADTAQQPISMTTPSPKAARPPLLLLIGAQTAKHGLLTKAAAPHVVQIKSNQVKLTP